jgi:hypothetical protein
MRQADLASPWTMWRMFWGMGILCALLIGAELGTGDFERKVEWFWQSRPIGMGRYYWKRFALGAVCVVGMLTAAVVCIEVLDGWHDSTVNRYVSYQSRDRSQSDIYFRFVGTEMSGMEFLRRKPGQVIGAAVLLGLPVGAKAAAAYAFCFAAAGFMRRRVLAIILTATAVIGTEWLGTAMQIPFYHFWDNFRFGWQNSYWRDCLASGLPWLAVAAMFGAVGYASMRWRLRERIEAFLQERVMPARGRAA